MSLVTIRERLEAAAKGLRVRNDPCDVPMTAIRAARPESEQPRVEYQSTQQQRTLSSKLALLESTRSERDKYLEQSQLAQLDADRCINRDIDLQAEIIELLDAESNELTLVEHNGALYEVSAAGVLLSPVRMVR